MTMPNIVRAAVVGHETPDDGITFVAAVAMEPAGPFDEGGSAKGYAARYPRRAW